MFKFLTCTLTAAMAVTISGAAERPVSAFSADTLAALDPTRAGRQACRPDRAAATLDRRLAMARRYITDTPAGGSAPMPLLAGIPRTQLPAGKLEGDARRYFDQGMLLAYGFNHVGAIRSFREARRRDPACVMCWWGEALANGPNINAGMDDANNRAALAALDQAKAALPSVSPEERALIEAQLLRYSPLIRDPAAFAKIVRDGALQSQGMVAFGAELSPEDVELIRAYVIRRAHEASHSAPAEVAR